MPNVTLLDGCRRQGDVGHQCGELRVLAGGRQQLNDNAGVRGSDLINQQRQVFAGVLSDTKKQRKNPDLTRSVSNQVCGCVATFIASMWKAARIWRAWRRDQAYEDSCFSARSKSTARPAHSALLSKPMPSCQSMPMACPSRKPRRGCEISRPRPEWKS